MKRLTLWLLLASVLAGCADNRGLVLAPIEPADDGLHPSNEEYRLQPLWARQVGDGVGDYFLRLPPLVTTEASYAADREGRVYAFASADGAT